MYTKQQLQQATDDMVDFCKDNSKMHINITFNGKKIEYYIDCEEFITLQRFINPTRYGLK